MSVSEDTMMSLLLKKTDSDPSKLLDELRSEFGPKGVELRQLTALALCKVGYPIEEVAKLLTWNEFEGFCANVLSASGFKVVRNLVLVNPRKQIDIYAYSEVMGLSIDCKHWRRSMADLVLYRFAAKQLERSELLRRTLGAGPPIVSVILTMLNEPPRILGGVAVVPLLSLRDFVSSVEGFFDRFRLV